MDAAAGPHDHDAGRPDPAKLLTLRDSTGDALSPLWSWSFGTTVQYGHEIGMNNEPTAAGPDPGHRTTRTWCCS